MKATISRYGCYGCGVCSSVCPDVFRMDDEGLAETIAEKVPSGAENSAKEAAGSCPARVIVVE